MLSINLVVLSIALIGILFIVNGVFALNSLVVALCPIDIGIVVYKLISLARDKEIKTKRALLQKLFFSSQILDSIARCISCILFFAVQYVEGFFYTLCLGPVLITSLVIVLKNSCVANKVNYGR